MLRAHEAELGVEMVPFQNLVYVEDLDAYLQEDQVPQGARTLTISGTDLRSRLAEGREIPAWFTLPRGRRPSCAAPIRRATGRASPSS